MLLGRNGAGKTTTLRTIMGLWRASQGLVTFDGTPIGGPGTRKSPPDMARMGMAYVPENMGIFADLSVKENILLAARQARSADQLDTARLEWIFGFFPALKKFWLHPAGKLSGGQKQMLAVARAIIEPRRLLLIDEPSKGLAPAIIQNMIDAFLELKEASTTILLVEQNARAALQVADYAYVLETGTVTLEGPAAQVAVDPRVVEVYLGLGHGAPAAAPA
ncbi:hypothetical protein G6F31_013147 [Rhizopus arrhizus]|nr:hypothetical protein G6F31_013147 [Rhizopus arrhizus]